LNSPSARSRLPDILQDFADRRIMNLVESFVKNPVKVSVGVILVMMFGTLAIWSMPIQLTPEVQIPTLTIQTMWPGASPMEVEREIILEQEEQLQSVEGVKKMTSESMDSMGQITMEFAIGTNLADAMLRVNTRLAQVPEYPETADEPIISTSSSSDRPICWFILHQRPPQPEVVDKFLKEHPEHKQVIEEIWRYQNPALKMLRVRELMDKFPEAKVLQPAAIDITKLRRFAEDRIESMLERVDGVSNANVFGGRIEELQVVVDPQRLAARQLTINDLRTALRGVNKDTSGGDIWEGKRRYVIRTLGQFRSPEQVANTIIARQATEPVYVRDVAEVRIGYKKPDGIVQRYGTSVISLNALRESGTNVLTVMDGLKETARQLNEGILRDMDLQLTQVYDETEYIHSSIGLVADNIVEGGVLTFIVLLLFLRSVRSSFVIFISIGVSIVGMFLFMKLMGRSLNVPSLAGIAFAVGMLVDNFIVVLENIYRYRQQGETTLAATIKGTEEVWGAIVAATLANLAVFIPVLFVQDEAGQLFRDIALATSSAVALSLLVALIVVPTAAARILSIGDRTDEDENAPPSRGLSRIFLAVIDFFKRTLGPLVGFFLRVILAPIDLFGTAFVATVVGINRWLLSSVVLRMICIGTLVGVSVFASWLMMPKVEYLPSGNRNLVFGILLPPPGYNIEELQKMGREIEENLRPHWDVDPNDPAVKAKNIPIIADFFFVARGRSLFIGARAHDPLRARELEPLIAMAGASIPGTFCIAKQTSLFEQGLTGGRTIEIEITGPEITQLVALGGQILGQVGQIVPGAQARPIPSLDLSSPEMHVIPKWEQAADMGINASDLGYTIDALVDGAYATDYYIGGDKIDLSIVGDEKHAARTQNISSLAIATPMGDLAPLDAVANVSFHSGPEQINHRERQRTISIEVTPPASVPLQEAMDLIRTKILAPMKEQGLFRGIPEPRLSGTADKLKTTWDSLRWNLLLAVTITYLLMAALFESWLYPFVIILSVPLGAVGGFAGLWCLNAFFLPSGVVQQLDVLTMLGFIILVGTVVNNPILIVEQALNHVREDGYDPKRAVLESVRTRIRPIFMTALIGFFGLVPLVISPGAGSELYRGLGAVLLGGLLVSTIFTLFLIPSLFTLTMEISAGISTRWRKLMHGH